MSKKKSYSTQKVINNILATHSDSVMPDLTEDSDNENLSLKTVDDGGKIELEIDEST